MLYRFARPLLFSLDPETAHRLTLTSLDAAHRSGALCLLKPNIACSPREVMGLTFPNPVGLAAGLDKNAAHIDALSQLGFGFIEVGTVTPRPQPGNPQPRLFRLKQAQALINRLGFNNQGLDALLANIKRSQYQGIVGINIGKNFDTPIEQAAEDYLLGLKAAYPYASYITVNISSPNTQNLRQLQQADELGALLSQLKTEQTRLSDEHGRYVPLAVKIAPDLQATEIESIAQLLMAHHIDAVIATNTTLAREAVEHLPHGKETGGLSGAPLSERSTWVIQQLAQTLQGALPIIGVGGILSGQDALAKIQAGASLVQIYTGLIYRGPELVSECLQTLCVQA